MDWGFRRSGGVCVFTFCVCRGGAQLFSLLFFVDAICMALRMGHIVRPCSLSEWSPCRSVNYKTISTSHRAFLLRFKVLLCVPRKTDCNGHFLAEQLCETPLPSSFFLFVTVLWHRKLWSGQSAKVQASSRLLICFYLSKCSRISLDLPITTPSIAQHCPVKRELL